MDIRPMRSLLSSLLLPIAAAIGINAAAQQPTPEAPRAAPVKFTAEQEASARYYKMMLDMTLATQELPTGKEQVLHDKLIVIYERLVELYCMPEALRTLEHAGDPANAECVKYMARLGELYADDPVLLCAKHGIDSELCKNAYAEQYIDSYSVNDLDIYELDLKNKIRAELSGQEIDNLREAIEEREEVFKALREEGREKLPELRKVKRELDSDYAKLLNAACRLVRVKIVHEPMEDEKKAAARLGIKSRRSDSHPLQDLVRQFENVQIKEAPKRAKGRQDDEPDPFAKQEPVKEPVETNKAFWRVRYLTSQCMKALEKAGEFDPQLPMIACHMEGETSPNCIASLRDYRRMQQAEFEASRRKKPAIGFSTF